MLESPVVVCFLMTLPVVVVAALCWWTHFLGRRAGEADRMLLTALQESHEAHRRDLERAGKGIVTCVEITGKVMNGLLKQGDQLAASLRDVTALAVRLDPSKLMGQLASQSMAHMAAKTPAPPENGSPIISGYNPEPEPAETEDHPEITDPSRM